MRFLVFSDLHLDHTFAEVRPEGARRRRRNLRECLDRIIALADAVDADAILSAGDLYEQRHLAADTGDFLARRFGQAGRPVLLAPGCEDPYTPESVYATTRWPANVHVFDHDHLRPVDLAPGLRLWGAAHVRATGTARLLDGFRAEGDAVHVALLHRSELPVLDGDDDLGPLLDPYGPDRIREAGLAHAFLGHLHTPADGPWHTDPGNPDPLAFGEVGQRGAVVVDVGDDGTVRRQRHVVAVSQVHDVVVDVTGAQRPDDVLDRVLDAVGDLHGTVRVTLEGRATPGLDVRVDDVASWSSEQLEIVVRDRRPLPSLPTAREDTTSLRTATQVRDRSRDRLRAARQAHRDHLALLAERDAVAATLQRLEETAAAATPRPAPPTGDLEPAPTVVAAHEAWAQARGRLRRHADDEPTAAAPVDLGGVPLDDVEELLSALTAGPATTDPALADRLARLEREAADRPERPAARRAQTVAMLVAAASGTALAVMGESVLGRGLPALAVVLVLVIAVLRRRGGEDPELAAAREQVRADMLLAWRRNSEIAGARHDAHRALHRAGLPTDPEQLGDLVATARAAAQQQRARAEWEREREALVESLARTTARLRDALAERGVAPVDDAGAASARYEADCRARRQHRQQVADLRARGDEHERRLARYRDDLRRLEGRVEQSARDLVPLAEATEDAERAERALRRVRRLQDPSATAVGSGALADHPSG